MERKNTTIYYNYKESSVRCVYTTNTKRRLLCGVYTVPGMRYHGWRRLRPTAGSLRPLDCCGGPGPQAWTGQAWCTASQPPAGWWLPKKLAQKFWFLWATHIISHSNRSREGPKREREREWERSRFFLLPYCACFQRWHLTINIKRTGRDVLAVAFLLSRQLSKTFLDFFRNVSPYTVYSTACKLLGADLAWQRIFGGFVCLIFYAV